MIAGASMDWNPRDENHDCIEEPYCHCQTRLLGRQERYFNSLLQPKTTVHRTVFRNNITHIALRSAWMNPQTNSTGHSMVQLLNNAIIHKRLPRLKSLRMKILKLGREESTARERSLLVHAIDDLEHLCRDRNISFLHEFILM